MKRFIAILTLSTLFLVQSAWASFSDISSLHPNTAAIQALVDQGILTGYEDGTFQPDREVSRAEAVKIILLGMGHTVDEESIAGLLLSDVEEDDWFFTYVSNAVSLGIVNGYEDATFKPHETVNRAEAMKMLTLAASIDLGSPSEGPFVDVSAEAWFAPYADYAKAWNVEPPQTDGTWRASEAMTRANISEMVYRMQQVREQGSAFVESTNWLRHTLTDASVSLKTPFGWDYEQEGITAVWLMGTDQLTPLDPASNGGSILLSYNSSAVLGSSNTTINGYSAWQDGNSWSIALDEGVVQILALYGGGDYADYVEDYISLMVDSIEYVAINGDEQTLEEIIESLRSAIQVDAIGTQMMDLLDDWELFETDAIGVGTGPVDYFYSPSANITVKYERSFDVILDIENGQTSSF